MKDDEQVFLIVYFYGGATGWYKMSFKMAKWCFQKYKEWATNPKEKDMIIILTVNEDPLEGPKFLRNDLVAGFNLAEVDEEEAMLKKQQIREKIEALKKMGKWAENESEGENWKQ